MQMSNKLNSFLESASRQVAISAHHISLFASIYSVYESNQFQRHFHISRKSLMSKSKIRSNATYHKCLKDLVESGFITYTPSYHPSYGSTMSLI